MAPGGGELLRRGDASGAAAALEAEAAAAEAAGDGPAEAAARFLRAQALARLGGGDEGLLVAGRDARRAAALSDAAAGCAGDPAARRELLEALPGSVLKLAAAADAWPDLARQADAVKLGADARVVLAGLGAPAVEPGEALQFAREAREAAVALGDHAGVARACEALAKLALVERPWEAWDLLAEAATAWRKAGERREAAETLLLRGRLMQAAQNDEAALDGLVREADDAEWEAKEEEQALKLKRLAESKLRKELAEAQKIAIERGEGAKLADLSPSAAPDGSAKAREALREQLRKAKSERRRGR